MDKSYFVLWWSLVAIPLCVGVFEELPRIHTDDGNLVIESGKDRNISLVANGGGAVYVNGVNIMRSATSNFPILNNSLGMGRLNRLVGNIQRDLDNPRTGLKRRMRILENRTSSAAPTANPRRLRMLINRVTSISTQVETLIRKLEEDNCRSHPCQNGGVCLDLFDGFLCQCPNNWEGVTCGLDVNECARFAGTDLGCQNGASCHNTPGSYACICTDGYQGIHCTRKNLDCATGGAELCGRGTCIQSGVSFKCICDQGWTTDGATPQCTTDVNECASEEPRCSKDPVVDCVNTPGSFRCGACPPGFTGNGFYCTDINECDHYNGGCSMTPLVQCFNTPGSSHCGSCPIGYTGNGRLCQGESGILGLCARSVCHPLATCTEIGGNINCQCPSTHRGNGFGGSGCVLDASPLCPLDKCKNGGTCNTRTMRCACPAGFQLPYCEPQTRCASNPCQNDGECVDGPSGSFTCNCPTSFMGLYCERRRTGCNSVLRGASGALQYPPENTTEYGNNARCAWLIRTEIEWVLNVTITRFNVEDSASAECLFDFVQIHDGSNSAAHSLGRFCGTQLPLGGNFLSTQNSLYLFFRSDGSHTRDGFALTWTSVAPLCGQNLTTSTHGTILSPGSPGNYPPNRDCWWRLSAPPGKRIQLHFMTMKIESHVTCDFDYLAIHDGHQEGAALLEKFCNTSHPEPFVSPANELSLHFHSDADNTDTGFQIHYTVIEGVPGCGGIFTELSGEISAPMQDGSYKSNLECDYLIKLPPGSRIAVQFNSFALEYHAECSFDYLELYEGSSDRDPLVRRYCGTDVPQSFTSRGNKLLFKFRTDWSNGDAGFRISYSIFCGGTFTSESGIVTSPMYPQPYHKSRECIYEIVAPPGNAITLDWMDFDLESNAYPSCPYDYVEVFDGIAEDSSSIGRYCSTMNPPTAVTKMNQMTIKFTSDSSVEGRGWKANYSFVEAGCGGVISTLNYTITPPMIVNQRQPDSDWHSGFDRFFRIGLNSTHHNQNCTWIIVAPPRRTVTLSWDSFDLEDSIECGADYVSVIEGSSSHKYCGTTIPRLMTTVGNIVKIQFVTDGTVSSGGFSLSYNFTDPSSVCGGVFFSAGGYLQSPNYPDRYPPFKECEWIIQAPPGHQILLKAKAFAMESHDSCNFDYLEVRNGPNRNSSLIGRYCGSTFPSNLRSLSNVLYVHFVSDFSHSESGFDIEWESTATGCGGVLTTHEGSISSPNYPQPYHSRAFCTYKITISQGSSLEITFDDFDFEGRTYCYDSVNVIDGKTMDSLTGGPICEKATPFTLTTTDNTAIVTFRSDFSDSGRGFSLNYKTLCNRTVRGLFSGVIESPNYPDNYPHHINCEWTIEVPLGNKIGLEFSHFAMEVSPFHTECNFDYLEIVELDGNSQEVSRKRHCSERPKPLEISSRFVKIVMHSDVSMSDSGFRMEWRIIGCGGQLDRPRGAIQESNYNKSTPTECVWKIVSSVGKHVELTIDEFHYEGGSSDCRNGQAGGLMIASGDQFEHPSLVQCSLLSPGTIVRSFGHVMYVKYLMKRQSPTSFRATYKESLAECGGELTNKGSLSSKNYPNNYDANQDCEWLLSVPEDHTMAIVIKDIDLYASENCSHTVLKIFDGPEALEHKSLFQWCNTSMPPESKIVTPSNKALIKFRSGEDNFSKGFLISFVKNCGYTVSTNSSGVIRLNDTDVSCTWTITSPDPMARISFQVNHFSGNVTRYQDVMTFVPALSSKQLLSETVYTLGNLLQVTLNVAGPVNLVASYSVFDNFCGGSYSSLEGRITSPGFPSSYPLNIECIYNIVASPGNGIQVHLTYNLESSENCGEDYIEVRERDGAGKFLGVFCGAGETSTAISDSTWIKFRSDNDTPALGYQLEYSYAQAVDILAKNSGELTSPLYPHRLLTSKAFKWRISVQFGSVMLVTFQEFVLQSLGSGLCATTFKVFDGYNEEAPLLLDSPCGYSPPEPVISTSDYIYITAEFNSRLASLFKLKWEAQMPQTETNNDKCNSSTIVLGNDTVRITSPGYPFGYDTSLNCSWIVKTDDPSTRVAFAVGVVDLEEAHNCLADHLTIYTSSDLVNWVKNDSMCNEMNRRVYHGTPYMKIQFVSDHYINKTGFMGNLYKVCGGKLSGSSGLIRMSSRLDRMMNSFCDWHVQVRNGRKIAFTFEEFDFPNHDNSCNSFVSIKNGPDEFSPNLGTGNFCGPEMPKNLNQTFSNNAYVRFNMRMLGNFKFALRYEEVARDCGDEIILTDTQNSTIIHTPNYPSVPEAHSECTWNVWSKSGEALKIEFIDRFDISYQPNCNLEFVELRSGSTKYSNVLGRFCGKTPDVMHSPTNMLQIKYFSDVPYPKTGFKARVSLSGCDRIFRGESGTIETPTDMHVSANTICHYTIIGSPVYKLNLEFTNTCSTSNYDDCSDAGTLFEVIAVYPGMGRNETRVSNGNYSHENFPTTLFVESSKAVIRFNASLVALHQFQLKLTFRAQLNNCGGTLTGSQGEITSPGYPTARFRQKFCNWLITVPKGRRIKVEVLDLDISNHTFPMLPRVSFYNDMRPSMRIAAITGSTIPEPIYSTDNIMRINYFVINGGDGRGFKLKYSSDEATVCEGTLDEATGILEKPANLNTSSCAYQRTDKPFFPDTHRGTISFRIQDTKLMASYSSFVKCNSFQSALQISRGRDTPSVMARVCGEIPDKTISSPFTNTNFEAGVYLAGDTYKVYYELDRCGEIFTGPFTVSSADLPSKSGALNCGWFYKSEQDAVMTIKYNGSFVGSCAEEYLTIYNGPSIDSPQLAKICGDQPQTEIHSRSLYLLMQYHANFFNSSTKFHVQMHSLMNACGGTVHKSIPRIQTPGNGSYENNMDCEWELVADPGYTVNISFVDRFYLEDSVNCTKDSVEVFDYVNDEWKSLGKFCGRQVPGRLESSESKLKVRFVSDDRVVGDGFAINWEQQCGGVYHVSDRMKTLVSPGYPNLYPPELFCNYTFVAPQDKYIQIQFKEFALEKRRNCDFDNLTVHANEVYMTQDDLTARETFCSDKPPIQRYKKAMWLIFRTDKFVQKKGFEFTYQLESCGGVITDSTTIETNANAATYATLHKCVWNITAPTDMEVVIRFNYFELGHQQGCYSDFVDIFAGSGTDAKRLIHLCGNLTNVPAILLGQSEGSIHFNSGYESFRGFSAEVIFRRSCSRRINLTTSAPTYELSETGTTYVEDMDCHYVILAPSTYTLRMQFTNFHMQECQFNETAINKCSCDYLEIRDGRGPFAQLLGTYCGHEMPPAVDSTRDGLYVRLVTDSGPVSSGFTARITIVPNTCGQLEFDVTYTPTMTYPLRSDGSSNYNDNANCVWMFTNPGSEYATLHLRFDRMDIQNGTTDLSCDNDWLEVYDNTHKNVIYEGLGEDLVFNGAEQTHVQKYFFDGRTVQAKHVYCGSRTPPVFMSKTNQVFVRFRSNSEVTGKGFSITASKDSGCHPIYEQLQGRITFSSAIDCDISVTVPDNHTVSLYFSSFSYSCDGADGIQVFDGDFATGTVKNMCGYSNPNPIFSTGNKVSLRIKAQSYGSLDVTYLASDKGRGCGGTLYNYHGAFASPLFPEAGRSASDCRWDIIVPSNLKVVLRFTTFDMGNKQYCNSNYVILYDITKDSERELSRLCGGDNPAPIMGSTNAMAVRFVKTVNFGGSGFQLEFMAVFENANVTNF